MEKWKAINKFFKLDGTIEVSICIWYQTGKNMIIWLKEIVIFYTLTVLIVIIGFH